MPRHNSYHFTAHTEETVCSAESVFVRGLTGKIQYQFTLNLLRQPEENLLQFGLDPD